MSTLMGIIFVLCFLLALKLRSQRGKEAYVSLIWNAIWSPARFLCATALMCVPSFGAAYWAWIHGHPIVAGIIAFVVFVSTVLLLAVTYLMAREETKKVLKEGLSAQQRERLAFQREIQEQAPSS